MPAKNKKKKEEKLAKASICLVMIVKNESKVIQRCIDSVKDYIDYWVICDTGSSDGTQQIIKDLMEKYGIPGELHEREWKDYGTNRTESLDLSFGKCDYRLVIDADDYLDVINSEKLFTNLDKDFYKVRIKLGHLNYFRAQVFKSDQKWRYVGVLHEYPEGPKDMDLTDDFIEDAEMIASVSGDKREETEGKNKYLNDALIFEKELKSNPDLETSLKSRYQFYLAQSYRDAQMYDKSIDEYQKRVEMGGWHEEVYVSLYMIARMNLSMDKSDHEIVESFLKAWEFRPVRLEAAYHLIRFLITKKRFFLAFTIASSCIRMHPCEDILFVESDIWHWKMLDEYSVLAYYTGNIKMAYEACKTIMQSPVFDSIEEKERERIENNFSTFDRIHNEKKVN
jgi:glycosyltransferase involved in cell wall biosynthesis